MRVLACTYRHCLKIAVLSLLLTLLLTLVACGGSSNIGPTTVTATAQPTPQKATIAPPKDLVTPGTLTIGADANYPPMEYIDVTTRQQTGFDIDLITAIAQKMGLQPKIVNNSFDSLINSLQSNRYDVVISGVTINNERKQKVDFVPYFSAGESILVRKGNPEHIKSLADLCGKSVGVQNGTVEQPALQFASQACQKSGKSVINITVLQDQSAVIQLLGTGRVVATYQDSPITDYYLKQHPAQFEVAGSVINAAALGIAVRKGDSEMQQVVQQAFNELKKNGTYHALITKWGLTSGEITSTSDAPVA